MLIPLSEWAKTHFKNPPCTATLRKIASTGQTDPPAQFIVRRWYVDEKAVLIGIVNELESTPAPTPAPTATVLDEFTYEFLRKLNDGRTKA